MRFERNMGLSNEDRAFLKKLDRKDIEFFFDFTATAASYEVITNGIPGVVEGTHQLIRDIKIAQLLQDKFHNIAAYTTSEGFKTWLEEKMSGSINSQANALNRLQGDGAGEIDFLRKMQGSLRSLFTKTDFVRDASGHIPSNTGGIDLQEINRITGKVINEYQVKSLRSLDTINETLKEFVNNKAYDENIVLVGPKELIEAAKKQGLKNPTKIMGSVHDNAKSAEALKNKVLAGDMATELTAKAVIGKIAGGALIGAGISIGISSLTNYIEYKKGKISKEELFEKAGKEGAKGAISGGALAGLSLFVPGGLIGIGIGFVVGTYLRRVLDDAFGDGIFAEVLDLTRSIQVNVHMLYNGSIYVADLIEANSGLMAKSISVIDDLKYERFAAENKLGEIEEKYHKNSFVSLEEPLENKLDNLDLRRERMENVNE